jgi:hypothetical protein
MKTFAARRIAGFATALVLSALLIAGNQTLALSFRPTAFYSGWLLLATVVFLAAFNLRKKLPFLPLGSAAGWLQLHVYVGLLSIVVFGLHVSWRIPNGIGEGCLAACFVTVAASGIVGLLLSRIFARRLTVRGGEILWDRIARLRGRLSRDVERLALQCLAETDSQALVSFYTRRLRDFFAGPRNLLAHLVNSTRPRNELLAEIASQRRYLSDPELKYIGQIEKCVEAKDDLDYQFALQSTLKYWLFLHVPLTYALIVFAVVHLLLVHAY